MPQQSTVIRIVLTSITLLLFVLALLWPWISPVSLIILPSPDRVVILVNGEEAANIEQPVPVKIDKPVIVQVEVYYQGQVMKFGEFSYQWCFDPPIDNDLHTLKCLNGNYRGETNSDYKPENTDRQKLTITIRHDVLKSSTISLLFEPK